MMQSKEILDLVDDQDKVIGSETRTNIYAQGLHNFRVVYGIIENDFNELWVPRRVASKSYAKLQLDSSVGGHVASGESYESALKREAEEELNLSVENESIVYLGKLSPKHDGSYAHAKVWKIRRNVAPNYNSNDFCEAFWLSPSEIMARQAQGDQVISDFILILHKYFKV